MTPNHLLSQLDVSLGVMMLPPLMIHHHNCSIELMVQIDEVKKDDAQLTHDDYQDHLHPEETDPSQMETLICNHTKCH